MKIYLEGNGDYTQEHQYVLDENSIDDIAGRIRKRKEQNGCAARPDCFASLAMTGLRLQ